MLVGLRTKVQTEADMPGLHFTVDSAEIFHLVSIVVLLNAGGFTQFRVDDTETSLPAAQVKRFVQSSNPGIQSLAFDRQARNSFFCLDHVSIVPEELCGLNHFFVLGSRSTLILTLVHLGS